jgi:hypothetical protein
MAVANSNVFGCVCAFGEAPHHAESCRVGGAGVSSERQTFAGVRKAHRQSLPAGMGSRMESALGREMIAARGT